jgi:secretion/DNA translocation related TadE-like protein
LTPRTSRRRGGQGSVTVVMTAVVVLGLVLGFVVLEVGAFVSQRSRASAAADAAALAAADQLAQGLGPGAAAAAAANIAIQNGARLVRCVCDALDAVVTVSFSSRLPLVPPIVAHARAVVDVSGSTALANRLPDAGRGSRSPPGRPSSG